MERAQNRKGPKKRHVVAFAVVGAALLTLWACIQRPMRLPLPDTKTVQFIIMPQSAVRDVDILFVIDNSQSMLNEQTYLRQQFVSLMNGLKAMQEGLPNVHIGVVSSDLGTGNYTTIRYCEAVGGDKGILGMVGGVNLGETCIGQGQRYIVDVEPAGCEIEKDDAGVCSSHGCTQQNCQAAQQGNEALTFGVDDRGCPRCRNYTGTLEETFACVAELGVLGCGFEQQLEAMHKALNQSETPENRGFLRDNAFLSVIIISDEDDCSASRPDVIFNPDPNENRIDSTLGFVHSFRCFEFGVTCNVNGRDLGPRSNCVPREDEQALLHPISRYTSHLEALKDPSQLVVASIAGPSDGSVTVQMDSRNRPDLKFVCTDSTQQGATPGVRIKAFTAHFNEPEAMGVWAYTSVCNSDYSTTLEGIAQKLVSLMKPCFIQPFDGCPQGPAGTACAPCLPNCTVVDIQNRSKPEQKRMIIPWCGQVCVNGLCTEADIAECEYDQDGRCICTPPLYPTRLFGRDGCAPLYLSGQSPPSDRDPNLADLVPRQEPGCVGPDCKEGREGRESACWYMDTDDRCPYITGFRILRAADPPPYTFAETRCWLVPLTELLCQDGEDNDQDCLVDREDPDCAAEPVMMMAPSGRSGCSSPTQN